MSYLEELNHLNRNYERTMLQLEENIKELDYLGEKIVALTVALSYQGDTLESLVRITDMLVMNAKEI